MATPPPEPANPPPHSPWPAIIFGSLFVLASILIFTGTLYHGTPDPDDSSAAPPTTNAASASR